MILICLAIKESYVKNLYYHLGGSANALARSVAYISTKNHSAEVPEDRNGYVKFCSEVALKGKAAPMDLARVKTKDGRVYTRSGH